MNNLYYTNQTIDRKYAREIELKIEKSTNLVLDNPFYDGDAKEVKALDGTGTSDLSPDEIVGRDLKRIKDANGLLALLTNDKDIGSCMEIAIASFAWGKPVYVIAMLESSYHHPWIKYFANEVFATPYEFIKFSWSKWGKPDKVDDELVKQIKFGFRPKGDSQKGLKKKLLSLFKHDNNE